MPKSLRVFRQVLTKERKRRRADSSDSEGEARGEGDNSQSPKDKQRTKKKRSKRTGGSTVERLPKKKPGEEGYDPYDFDSEAEDSQEGMIYTLTSVSSSIYPTRVGYNAVHYTVPCL